MKQVSLLIKPASSLCNMRCIYCFYKDVSENRENASYGVMSEETMKNLIDKTLGMEVDQINYCFQGGEPTVAGTDYFHAFIDYVNEQNKGKKITYAIQTNGTLINDEWLKIFKDNDFLVGVSLDGFLENNDFFRGKDTFDKIIASIHRLEEEKIRYNILTVLTKKLAEKPDRLYNFYKRYNFDYVQLIPCLPSLDKSSPMDQYALTPYDFSRFYKRFFDRWYQDFMKGLYTSVTLFDNVIPMYRGIAPSLCGMLGKCHMQLVVEGDGGVYPCDFFVLDEYKCGNINENSINEIVNAENMYRFLSEDRNFSNDCLDCPFMTMCHGNCKRLAVCYYNDKYCGYRDFLAYSKDRMIQIARTIR